MNLIFQVAKGIIHRYDIGQFEKGRLHDHVDTSAQTHFTGNFNGIDVIELQFLAGDGATHFSRQLFIHFVLGPG